MIVCCVHSRSLDIDELTVVHIDGFEDLAGKYSNEEMMAMGLPAVPAKDIPTCNQGEGLNGGNPCDREGAVKR